MKYKVKIKKLPEARAGQQVNYGLYNTPAMMGDMERKPSNKISVAKTIGAVPRSEANLEAEGGETVMTDLTGIGIPQQYTIKGPRHAQGGVPMNLPDLSFVFSDFNQMKIKDPDMLSYFNKGGSKKTKGLTPAEIAKQYDINKYIKILKDPNSDKISKETAELMIKNYNLKLGALGLAQEAKKGFETGVPSISKPYMEHMGITEEDLGINNEPQMSPEQMMYGGNAPRKLKRQEGGVPPGMAAPTQQPQEQAPQQDPMAQIMPMIEQMVNQGAEPNDIALELTSQGVPPDMILQAFVSLGMPQGEAEVAIEAAMTNMQEQQAMMQQEQMPQEAMPMAMYGMEMGGYSMPFYAAGGSFNNPGFNALPEYVQAKIKGDLPKAQSGVEYDVYDKPTREELEGKGYTFVNPADPYKYTQGETVGAQRRSKGWKIDPESGFYYNPDEGQPQPGKEGLEDFINRHKEIIEEYSGGVEGWKKDQLAAKGKQNKAMSFVVDTLNDFHTELTGRPLVDTSISGAYIPGTELYNLPGIKKIEEVATQKPDDKKDKKGERPDLTSIGAGVKENIPIDYWNADVRNIGLALRNLYDIDTTYPWSAPAEYVSPDLVYLDPTRAAAGISEQQNIANQALASFTGPQATSVRTSGNFGAAAGSIADLISNYNTQNVGIANQEALTDADVETKQREANRQQAIQDYAGITIADQQTQNAERQARAQLALAQANAQKNALDTAFINMQTPNYNIIPDQGIEYIPSKTITPTQGADFNYWLDEYRERGFEPREAIAAAKIAMGQGYTGDPLIGYSQKGGLVMGSNVFPFMFY